MLTNICIVLVLFMPIIFVIVKLKYSVREFLCERFFSRFKILFVNATSLFYFINTYRHYVHKYPNEVKD